MVKSIRDISQTSQLTSSNRHCIRGCHDDSATYWAQRRSHVTIIFSIDDDELFKALTSVYSCTRPSIESSIILARPHLVQFLTDCVLGESSFSVTGHCALNTLSLSPTQLVKYKFNTKCIYTCIFDIAIGLSVFFKSNLYFRDSNAFSLS